MAEEKKLGPSVTYTNPDKGAKLVTVAGILLKEGQSVNIVQRLGEKAAEPILKRLANSTYFKVDGGPDHAAALESQRKVDEAGVGDAEATANQAIREEARIRKEQGDEAADKYVSELDEYGQPKSAQRNQSNYAAPEEPKLEQPAPRRRGSE